MSVSHKSILIIHCTPHASAHRHWNQSLDAWATSLHITHTHTHTNDTQTAPHHNGGLYILWISFTCRRASSSGGGSLSTANLSPQSHAHHLSSPHRSIVPGHMCVHCILAIKNVYCVTVYLAKTDSINCEWTRAWIDNGHTSELKCGPAMAFEFGFHSYTLKYSPQAQAIKDTPLFREWLVVRAASRRIK